MYDEGITKEGGTDMDMDTIGALTAIFLCSISALSILNVKRAQKEGKPEEKNKQ